MKLRQSYRKRKLINGLEVDVVFARQIYKYLDNDSSLVKFAKKCINKRERKQAKIEISTMNLDHEYQQFVNDNFWELI